VVNLRAIEQITHYGDRLYRLRLRDRLGTEITASRTGAARLAAVLKTTLKEAASRDLTKLVTSFNQRKSFLT